MSSARIGRRALLEWQTHYTSHDYVDYTWHAPTVRLLTMRPRLRPPSPGYEYPGLGAQRAGRAAGGDQSRVFFGAKTIAATLLDRLTEPTLLQQAQDKFRDRTGGGVGGSKWVMVLLPKDSNRRSTCAGPNKSTPHAARNGGSRPQPQASGIGDPL